TCSGGFFRTWAIEAPANPSTAEQPLEKEARPSKNLLLEQARSHFTSGTGQGRTRRATRLQARGCGDGRVQGPGESAVLLLGRQDGGSRGDKRFHAPFHVQAESLGSCWR